MGTSSNAVKTQIWTALICTLLRMNLFTHRDLMAWIVQLFAAPPGPGESQGMPHEELGFA